MNKAKILCYKLKKDKLNWYIEAGEYLNFSLYCLSDEDLDIKISELLEKQLKDINSEDKITYEIDDEIILFANFSKEELNKLLNAYRVSGLEKINLKAVLTETNINWSFRELYADISEEHAYMQKLKEENR